ncbi:MAG TPA: hypothetical protein VFA99_17275 [Acidobacteriaceae bacterium]|nr:hypothetical protein [Acidobacteriaceae bacterium]
MRLRLMLCGVTTLVPALLLTGCGMDQVSTVTANVQSAGVAGQVFGGQQPVSGATISVYAVGTTGYGSTATVLSSTTTDVNGNFSMPPYTCPQSDTPVYLLGIGGNSGAGNNASAVLGAGLGPCASAQQSFVILNEVTTAGLAFTLSHFFSTTLGGANGVNDSIGGPSTTTGGTIVYSNGLVRGMNYTIPSIIETAVGAPTQNSPGVTIEAAKINTIANILAACINSAGSPNGTETKTTCGKLFHYTQNGATTRPSDTLQAAVQMALHPTTEVANLYNLGTTTPPFSGLPTQPNDWSIGVSYTSSSVGLSVNTGTLSTLDIDSAGRIWFPSNASGQVGAAFFDPTTQSFSGPYNTTGLVFPQQVAIDANGYAWYNDSANTTVPGYLVTGPATTESVSLPNTNSESVTVGGDDRINVGITDGGRYELANISTSRSSYSIASGVTFAFPVQSIAGDISDGDAVAITDPTTSTLRNYYVKGTTSTQVVNSNDDSGQVIYTGNDDIDVRSAGTGGANAALCFYSAATCYNFKGGLQDAVWGAAIDGGKQIWVADATAAGVLQVPVNNPTATGSSIYLNSNGNLNIPANSLLHGSGNGGTATIPYGIGVDVTGNVWVTNAGCTTTNCTPGTFTLTEIVGAGYPTITPVSAQITSGNLVGTEPTQ